MFNMFSKSLARQLRGPSAIMGQLIFAPLWNRRNVALNDETLDRLALQAGDDVLEVGFGGGYLLGQMLSIVTAGSAAGIDISPAMVNFCANRYRTFIRRGQLDLQCATAEAIPYPANRFSKVCSVNSIFYWSDAARAIGECWRVLCEGGICVLCFTDRASLSGRSFVRHGLKLFESDEVIQMMNSAGFGEIEASQGRDRHRVFWCVVGKKNDFVPSLHLA